MRYEKAKDWCHVRSAIYRLGNPTKRYYKNDSISLDEQIPYTEKQFDDWGEYDPRDDPESLRYNEFPA
jgi:hypothetical protein